MTLLHRGSCGFKLFTSGDFFDGVGEQELKAGKSSGVNPVVCVEYLRHLGLHCIVHSSVNLSYVAGALSILA